MATRSSHRSNSTIRDLIGRNIADARRAADLSQTELAREAGVTDGQIISKWERGVHRPSDEALLALGAVLGHDLAWFFTDHDADPVPA